MFPIVAATLTALGALGLVISSLTYTTAASELIFNGAAICLVTGPLAFFGYVVIGLCIEFAYSERKPQLVTVYGSRRFRPTLLPSPPSITGCPRVYGESARGH